MKSQELDQKAGGPEYLKRLCYEQSISNNTAAMGGNAIIAIRSRGLMFNKNLLNTDHMSGFFFYSTTNYWFL